jgi:hypothetical protein
VFVSVCLPFAQGYGLHCYPAQPAIDSAQGINEKYRNSPKRHELKSARFQGVITRPPVTATGTDRAAVSPGNYLDEKHQLAGEFRPLHGLVNKGLELLPPIQNSLQLHPGFFSRIGFAWPQYQLQDLSQDALPFFVRTSFFEPFSSTMPAAWAEDRAMLGSNPSADPGPKTRRGVIHGTPFRLHPALSLGIGIKAINPGGMGAGPHVKKFPFLFAFYTHRFC